MIRFASILGIAFSLIVAATFTTRAADPIGVAACDDFLTKYEACLTSKIPAAQRASFQTQIDQTRKGWADLAKNPSTKAALEAACKQTSQQMKAAMQPFGCTF
jgi:hypothetical protein